MPSDNVYGTLINVDSATLLRGMIVRISAANGVQRAQADSSVHLQGLAGVVNSGFVGVGGPATNVVAAAVRQRVLLDTGLTPVAGETLYVSAATAGRATNVAPATIVALGVVQDAGEYSRNSTVWATVNTPPSTSGGGGVFPGYYGTATEAIGPASFGVSTLLARGDHSHPWLHVANQAALDLVVSGGMLDGQRVWVDTYKDSFTLTASTQSVAANVRRTALGKTGYLWIRDGFSPGWWNQTTWVVNPSTGSDEGAVTLATFAEYRRRHFLRWLPGTETGSVGVTIVGDLSASDYVTAAWSNGLRGGSQVLTVTGTPVVVATGTIVAGGFNAQNRATGQRNTINAGFDWAAHVNRQIRLQGTNTTVATVMEDLTGNVCALGEQGVNGVLGAGFTIGQTIEVVTYSRIPGLNVAGPGSPDTISLVNVDCDGVGAAFNCRHSGGATSTISALNSRFIGTVGGTISAPNFRPFACTFVGPGSVNINAAWFGDLTTTVSMPAGGLVLINPFDRNHIANHTSQGDAFTVGENCYANISGTGGGLIGIFGLAAGRAGITINIGGHLSCSNMWGSGNNAGSYAMTRLVGSSWSKVGDGASSFNTIGTVGMLLHRGVGSGDLLVPLAALASAIGDGQQPGSRSFVTGKLTSGVGAVFTYCAGSDAPTANQATRWAPPTTEATALGLRVDVRAGALGVIAPVTLYKNGAPTTMTITIAAGAAVGTLYADLTHAILFADGDTWDVRADAGIDGTPGDLSFSAQVEWAG